MERRQDRAASDGQRFSLPRRVLQHPIWVSRPSVRRSSRIRGFTARIPTAASRGIQLPAPRVGQPQSSLEQFAQVNPHEKPAQRVQVRLVRRIASADSV
jgi:hypothetical protein